MNFTLSLNSYHTVSLISAIPYSWTAAGAVKSFGLSVPTKLLIAASIGFLKENSDSFNQIVNNVAKHVSVGAISFVIPLPVSATLCAITSLYPEVLSYRQVEVVTAKFEESINAITGHEPRNLPVVKENLEKVLLEEGAFISSKLSEMGLLVSESLLEMGSLISEEFYKVTSYIFNVIEAKREEKIRQYQDHVKLPEEHGEASACRASAEDSSCGTMVEPLGDLAAEAPVLGG